MRDMERNKGRVTIPTDVDVVPETLELLKRWGADAIRDCDGTDFPEALKGVGAKVYSTYYTTRKDNAWAKANPDEVQQCYIMTGFYSAADGPLSIPLMQGISDELMAVNTRDDKKRWWEVMDRTAGVPVDGAQWDYDEQSGCVVIPNPIPFHDYAEDEAVAKFGQSPRQYETVVDHIETNEAGKLVGVVTAKTRWTTRNGKAKMEVLEEGKTLLPADLLLIASGFAGCENSVLESFGISRTKQGCAATVGDTHATANPQVFVAGDMRRGPSLVVWAIAEGRAAAREVDAYLLGYSNL